jgi:hypothetical protein
MKILKILRDHEHYMEFTTDLEEMLDAIGPRVGDLEFMHFSRHNLSLAEHWESFSGTFKKVRTGADQLPDITCWRGATLVLSDAAKNVLETQLKACGELLPINCNGQTYYIFNCLELASLNMDLSKQLPLEQDLIEFENIVFDKSNSQEIQLFKSKEEGCTAVFCSEKFAQMVNENGLKGIRFLGNLTEIF